jgi:hypothetical protein
LKSSIWNNVKATYNSSDADGQWRRFSITRTGYPSDLYTACFDIYTDNLINASGTIEFDLRANIHTMNQGLTVKTLTQAIQYRNSSAGEVDTLLTQAEAVYDDAGNFQYGFKAN